MGRHRLHFRFSSTLPSIVFLFAVLSFPTIGEAMSQQNQNYKHPRAASESQGSMMPMTTKPRILCLHGLSQSGAIFSNKIGGARRKLTRQFELDFLDGPVSLQVEGRSVNEDDVQAPGGGSGGGGSYYGWWTRNEHGQHVGVEATFEYIRQYILTQQDYDAVLGFSQGGLLATALALSGDMPSLKAVVTAGAPHVDDALDVALARGTQRQEENGGGWTVETGKAIPKLHFAGETDAIIPVDRVERLSSEGGNGTVLLHEKGHLFPTKAAQVNAMMEFLEQHLLRIDAPN